MHPKNGNDLIFNLKFLLLLPLVRVCVHRLTMSPFHSVCLCNTNNSLSYLPAAVRWLEDQCQWISSYYYWLRYVGRCGTILAVDLFSAIKHFFDIRLALHFGDCLFADLICLFSIVWSLCLRLLLLFLSNVSVTCNLFMLQMQKAIR